MRGSGEVEPCVRALAVKLVSELESCTHVKRWVWTHAPAKPCWGGDRKSLVPPGHQPSSGFRTLFQGIKRVGDRIGSPTLGSVCTQMCVYTPQKERERELSEVLSFSVCEPQFPCL